MTLRKSGRPPVRHYAGLEGVIKPATACPAANECRFFHPGPEATRYQVEGALDRLDKAGNVPDAKSAQLVSLRWRSAGNQITDEPVHRASPTRARHGISRGRRGRIEGLLMQIEIASRSIELLEEAGQVAQRSPRRSTDQTARHQSTARLAIQ
jgi:hypothetical protein